MRRRAQVRAKDIMTQSMITVDAAASIREAATVLLDAGISGAPVRDAIGRIVGLISLRDIARFERERFEASDVDADVQGRSSTELPWGFHLEGDQAATVQQYMTPIVIAVSEAATLQQIIRTFIERRIHRVLVRDQDGEIVGLVSALDVLQSMLVDSPAEALVKSA